MKSLGLAIKKNEIWYSVIEGESMDSSCIIETGKQNFRAESQGLMLDFYNIFLELITKYKPDSISYKLSLDIKMGQIPYLHYSLGVLNLLCMQQAIPVIERSSKWITAENARNGVQRLRNKYDAILTTSKTVQIDNPSLTCRMENGRNPIRIVIDRNNVLNNSYKVFNNDGTDVIKFSGELSELMDFLFEKNIKSVLVEAGGIFNGALLQAGYVDKIYQFIAPKILGNNCGVSSYDGLNTLNINSALNFEIKTVKNFQPDIMLELYPEM